MLAALKEEEDYNCQEKLYEWVRQISVQVRENIKVGRPKASYVMLLISLCTGLQESLTI